MGYCTAAGQERFPAAGALKRARRLACAGRVNDDEEAAAGLAGN